MCLILLMVCVIGIANGPVGMEALYEEDVQKQVVEHGYKTEDLTPCIPPKVLIRKWCGTIVGFPAIAAAIAGIITLL